MQSRTNKPGFQYLEDMATAYWQSEVLFASIELGLFDYIEKGYRQLSELAKAAGCRPNELNRLLRVLCHIGLVREQGEGLWQNEPISRQYLVTDSNHYIGNFLSYRKYLRTSWQDLTDRISNPEACRKSPLSPTDSYARRNFYYVRAMDEIARQKAAEIAECCRDIRWSTPMLDIGGGGAALSRRLLDQDPLLEAVLIDLPEVVEDARRLYPNPEAWERIRTLPGDFLAMDIQNAEKFGSVLLGNFLHVYSPADAGNLLARAVSLLRSSGRILIHDYFPDRPNTHSRKGTLYDLNMMLNTHQGECHTTEKILSRLADLGCRNPIVWDLPSDSTLLIVQKP